MANGFAAIIKGLIFGVIFLIIWQIAKIDIGIWGIVIFFAIILLSILLSAFSLTSKLPSTSTRTILWISFIVVVIAVAIIFIPSQLSRSINYAEIRLPENFDNNETSKDYGYNRIHNRDFNGDFVIEDGKMQVLGGVRITNTDLLYEYPTFKFSIGRLEAGEVITISVLLESEHGICPFNFTVKGPTIGHSVKRVEIGVNKHDRIWVKIDNSQIDVGNYQFDTSTGSFDLVMDITSNKVQNPKDRKHPRFFEPSFNLDDIVFG